MKYETHKTEAVVLRSWPSGESNKTILLFTRSYGCLRAQVQGVRKISSRLRYGLAESSRVSVGLVRGKGGWRITYVIPQQNFYGRLEKAPEAAHVVARLLSVCASLIEEDGGTEPLFDTVTDGLEFLCHAVSEGRQIESVERLVLVRLLYLLGYVEHSGETEPFLESGVYTDSVALQAGEHRRVLTREINRALSEAQK